MDGARFDINIEGDALELLKQLAAEVTDLNKKVDTLEDEFRDSFNGVEDSLKHISFVAITDGLRNVKETLDEVSEPGLKFEDSMADLSAITGIVGDDLEDLGDKARATNEVFGGEAADKVESYKLLLSQLTPELAKFPEVLDGMARNVVTLSKTMKNDTAGAAEVLTTAMNQYGVSFDDPIKAQEVMASMMNAMAAGAKEGSAELPALKAGIQNVGGDAKRAGLSFEEMVSGLELLDKAGKKNAEGGVALRNVLTTLSQGRFLPKDVRTELANAGVDINLLADKSVKFTDRLRELQKVQGDSALITKLFGKENQLAASALIGSVDAQDKMTEAITGTNTAQEQAGIIMDTTSEKMSRLGAWFEDVKISIFEATGAVLPFTSAMFSTLQAISTVVPAIHATIKAVNWLRVAENRLIIVKALSTTWTGIMTAAQWALNVALNANPIGLVILAIVALIGVVTMVVKKYDEWGAALTFALGPLGMIINLVMAFIRHWDSIVEAFKADGIIGGLKRIGLVLLDALLMPLQQLLQLASKLPGLGGLAAAGAEKIAALRQRLDLAPEEAVEKVVRKEVEDKKPVVVEPEKDQQTNPLPFNQAQNVKTTQRSSGAGFSSAAKKEINVRIENLVNNLTIKTETINESAAELRTKVKEALVGAVRDFEVAVN